MKTAPFHGKKQNQAFFEGWYYKIDEAVSKNSYVFIIGISQNENGKGEAFLQFVECSQHRPLYYSFQLEEFEASQSHFQIRLAKNYFSKNRISINLPELKAELEFNQHIGWKESTLAPNIMGPLHYLGGLECNHGILSYRSKVNGRIQFDEKEFQVSQAVGYQEKDWGSNFPKAHIWLQCNQFTVPDLSLSVAIAQLNIFNQDIKGYAATLRNGSIDKVFSNYTFSRFQHSSIGEHYQLRFDSLRYQLKLSFQIKDSVALKTPVQGGMIGQVRESINSEVSLQLYDRLRGKSLYNTRGTSTGIEVAGLW